MNLCSTPTKFCPPGRTFRTQPELVYQHLPHLLKTILLWGFCLLTPVFSYAQFFTIRRDMARPAAQADADFGGAVAASGDFNNDGLLDALVTAKLADVDDGGQLKADAGEFYIFFGPAFDPAEALHLTEPKITNVPRSGPETGAHFGNSIAAVADINGDGIDDIVVGANKADFDGGLSDAGEAFVLFGKTGLSAAHSPEMILLTEEEPEAGAEFGWAVAGAGDVDNDGYNDVIIGAPSASRVGSVTATHAGEIFVFSKLSTAPGKKPFRLSSSFGITPQTEFGYAVAAAGDIDKDGFADIAVGAPGADAGRGIRGGQVEIFPFIVIQDTLLTKPVKVLRSPNPIAGERFGHSVACADLDRDGNIDIIVGVPEGVITGEAEMDNNVHLLTGSGKVFLFRGPDFDERKARLLISPTPQVGAKFGVAVANAGDLNQDGFDDFIVGSELENVGGLTGAGEAYVFFGRADVFTQPTQPLQFAPLNATAIRQAGANFGHAVAGLSCDLRTKVRIAGHSEPLLFVVGAPLSEQSGVIKAGKAFAFRPATPLICNVTITSPPSGISIFEDSVTVKGTVVVTGGRPPIRDSCNVNGIPFQPVAGQFSVRVPLLFDGANDLTATCFFFDADGQTTSCTQTVTVFRREPLQCELKIISPRANQVICDDSVEVSAVAAPPGGVPPFIRKSFVNGFPATFSGDTLSAQIPLVLGPNLIKVVCEFIDSQQTHFFCEDSLTVQGCQPLTCMVDIISPHDGAQICRDSVKVKATVTVSDPGLVKTRSCEINGVPATIEHDTLFATIPLSLGSNLIVASCAFTDTLDNEVVCIDSIRVSRCNTLACQLTILTPKSGEQICADSVVVTAETVVTGGALPITAVCNVNGFPATLIGSLLRAKVPLILGPNLLIATCVFTDANGDQEICVDSVNVVRCEKPTCQVSIITPPEGAFICKDSVKVTALASIVGGVPPIQRTCDINGIPARVSGDTIFATIPLVLGRNSIRASCTFTDIQGNTTSCADTIHVTRCEPLVCKVEITSPQDGTITCEDTIEVCLATSVSGGVKPITKVCTINGIPVTGTCAQVPLSKGNNVIIAQCTFTDSLGNRTACADTIHVFVTRLACTLTIQSPWDNSFVCATSIEVSGTTTLTGGVGPIKKTCTINGKPAKVDGNTFSGSIDLSPGSNTIIATCTFVDSLGCVAACSDTVAVFSDPTPPECTFNFDNLPVITGEAFDNESGIAKVEIVTIKNRTVTIEPFTVGDKVVRFSSDIIDPNESSGFTLRVTNVAGCEALCDPIILRLDPVHFPSFTFAIPHTDRFLSVNNHGLTRIALTLNQHELELIAAPNQHDVEGRTYIIPADGERTIDLVNLLAEGENSVKLTCEGPSGSYADVMFSDINIGTVTGVSEEPKIAETIPRTFELFQSYPNPFNPRTTIRFHVPAGWTQPITLRVFNMQGQLIITLAEGALPPGVHTATWEGKDQLGNPVASGVYLYQLTAGRMTIVKKMILAK